MKYLPEKFYGNEILNKGILQERFEKNEFISFSALEWDNEKRAIVAKFEDGIIGYLPESELCIENLKFINGFNYSIQTHTVLGKTACALITSFNGHEVILSRKKLQEKALQTLTPGKIYSVCIKSFSDIGIFADIAVGISAFIHNTEISRTVFNSYSDLPMDFGLYHGSIIPAKLLSTENNIKISFRQALNSPLYARGDIVYGIVRNELYDKTGYFIDISPNDTAIVDTNSVLNYGDRILVQIKSSETIVNGDDFYSKHHVNPIAK